MIDFRLYLISDRNQCAGRSFMDTIGHAFAAGVRCLQIREKDLPSNALYWFVGEVQEIVKKYQSTLLINDRADIVQATGADGVHLPETGLPPDVTRKCLPAGKLIGVSTHSLDRALEAEDLGADFVTFGPVFYTPSKAPYGDPLGLATLARVTASMNIPVFALGGINPENTVHCMDAGAHGVAAISAILAASDVQKAVADFRRSLGRL